MSDSKTAQVDLKKRGPVAWTFISLLVPFGILFWFHKTRRQIDFLNSEADRPQRLMNPWWITGPILALLGLLLALVLFAITTDTDGEQVQVDYLGSTAIETPSTPSGLDDAGGAGSTSAAYTLDDLVGVESATIEADEDDVSALFVVVGLALYLLFFAVAVGYLVVFIIYLVKHTDGVVALAGTNEDKALLLVMGILGAVVFTPLIAVVVYKSQEIINQALSDRQAGGVGVAPAQEV